MADLPARREYSLPATLAGLSAPVDRATYAKWGFGLMLLKYLTDAGLIFAFSGEWLSPLIYLTPLASLRLEVMASAPEWLPLVLVLWTLPFAWIGASMSVRRARDAGMPPVVGLMFFFPILNYLALLGLAALPSKPEARPAPQPGPSPAPSPAALPARQPGGALQGQDRAIAAALTGVAAGAAVAVAMTAMSTLALGSYGANLFISTPFVMGAISGLLYNLRARQGVVNTVLVGMATSVVSMGLMMLFALEGAICLAMASPLLVGLGIAGALVGRVLAQLEARRALSAPLFALPLFTWLEPAPGPLLHEVSTTVDIAAPPAAVWDAVVAFPEIPLEEVPAWYFQLGVAYPLRAQLDGEGVGAVRRCEFSTGAFVEPITAWEPPGADGYGRLAFDVVESPPTMRELGPWDNVMAPHLDGALQSQRGRFLLEPLPDGGTRLTGTTWYTFQMAPVIYWTAWSDAIIHAIHQRVLNHIGVTAGSAAG